MTFRVCLSNCGFAGEVSKAVDLLILLSGKKPFHRLPELAAHPQQNFSSNLNLAALHRGKVVLADPDTVRKLLLGHIESAEFPNPSPNGLPVHGRVRRSLVCP